ncbi:MAG: response regulator, partial [Deltaproteobacteria bacterium]|nr:response regulator [Deltaproteobacteria bacterium]
GYEVALARDGAEAIEIYKLAKDSGNPFNVVIMDLTVPGCMGGREAVEKLREIDPGVKAVVSSGYNNDPVMVDFKKYGFSGVIAKPYKFAELSEVLHKTIRKTGKHPVSISELIPSRSAKQMADIQRGAIN